MRVLEGLEPKNVFYYFEEICGIPHGSGNVDAISDYLKAFAENRNLEVIQDELKNIIIIKAASEGYEEEPPVILQGHMDMVAVHRPELDIDMKTMPLHLKVEGDKVFAEGTSLGGDDGIAVAYALAILDDDSISHPRLEVVITVDEETGMDGARGIDLSMLKGNRLLNLDSEEEGVFWTSCAGGARVYCSFAVKAEQKAGIWYQLIIEGLQGGHSGAEIHKERGNANKLAGRLLWKLVQKNIQFGLVSSAGGVADNAICRENILKMVVKPDCAMAFEALVTALEAELKAELAGKDDEFCIVLKKGIETEITCVCDRDLRRLAAFLQVVPNGVQAMSAHMPGLVETSLNLGILRADVNGMIAEFSVRSSIESSKSELIDRIMALTELAGGTAECAGNYPGWAYRVDSPLREKMIALYEEMYGAKPKVEAIHAGLECGLLASKIKDLDCVSLGPDMANIHTTEEYLSISSTKRVWDYLLRLLAEKDN